MLRRIIFLPDLYGFHMNGSYNIKDIRNFQIQKNISPYRCALLYTFRVKLLHFTKRHD
jgi:hypothetical protein